MKKNKKFALFALSLCLTLCFSLLLTSAANAKGGSFVVREVNVNQLNTLTYQEKAEQILNKFDSYEFEESKSGVCFEASIDISNFDLSGIDFLSTDVEETTKKYKTDLDVENEIFYVTTQYIQDGVVVYEEKVETQPYYDDYSDDYYIAMPDGTTVSVYGTLNTNDVDECSVLIIAGIALTAEEAAVLLSALVIAAAPVVAKVITTVITTVVSWVKSFWSWFRSLWTKKTVTKTTTITTTTITYTISIANTKVEAKPFDKNKKYEKGKYYIAIADTVDGFLYVTDEAVDEVKALAVLTSASYVTGATRGKNGQFPQLVISLYTPNAADALKIATTAGTILGNPGAVHHIANKPGYFNHYHPGGKYISTSSPHVFYGSAL